MQQKIKKTFVTTFSHLKNVEKDEKAVYISSRTYIFRLLF